MTSTELIKKIFRKLGRYKMLIITCGIALGTLLFFYAKNKRPVYTAKATVFPLTAPTDNTLSSSALSGLLGIEGSPKSFSNEAAINIIELSLSRTLRQRVAASRLPQFGNKTITELIVQDINTNKHFYTSTVTLPDDSLSMAIIGGELLENNINAKMSKNGVLELYFSNTDKQLITPIANVFIDKLSQFYIDLKITKALADYNFTIKKIDSLETMITSIDKKAVAMQNSTFFTPVEKLEYSIPKENISMEKNRISRQRDISVNNREEATWRLQKVTPIISVLDKPTEPFTVSGPSPLLYCIAGLIAGCILTTLLLISGLLFRYIKAEMYKSFFGNEEEVSLSL